MKTKIRKSKKAAEIVASIDDLLIEILIRLPPSSLFHFKIVSKHWYSLISKPEFRRFWRNPSDTNSPVGIFFPRRSRTSHDDSFEYLPFCSKSIKKFKDPSSSSSCIKILSSCRGLLLCEIIATSAEEKEEEKKKYYVYNPTTNQYSATLPKLPDRVTLINGMTLVFDPPYPHYKVFCVHRHLSRCHIEMYSSDTGAWTSSAVLQPFTTDHVYFDNGVYWNRAIHWLNSIRGQDALYFNVQGQLLGKMPNAPPPYRMYDYGRRNYYFGNSSDHLHYIPVYLSEINFNVYEMKRDYSEWFLKYRVDLSPCVAAIPRITATVTDRMYAHGCRYLFSLLSIVRRGGDHEEEDASFLVLQIPGQAVRFNIVPKTFEILHQSKSDVGPGAITRAHRANGFHYIESLSPV